MQELLVSQTQDVSGGSRIRLIRDVAEAAGLTALGRDIFDFGASLFDSGVAYVSRIDRELPQRNR